VNFGQCHGGVGHCQDISLPCKYAYVSFLCPMGGNIKCCPSKPMLPPSAIVVAGPATDPALCAGMQFPLAEGSLHHISVNWGGARTGAGNSKLCHTGIDLFTANKRQVVAIADGVVTAVVHSREPCVCTGKPVAAASLFVHHPSIGRTVNYGEMTASSVTLKLGQSVSQRASLGVAGACCLLHFEIWDGLVTKSTAWVPSTTANVVDPDGCATASLTTKPTHLIDPRPLVNCLKPAQASLLEDAGVGGELFPPPPALVNQNAVVAPKPISGGYIALIVVSMLLVLACCGVMVFCFVQHRRKVADAVVNVANPVYDSTQAAVPMATYQGSNAGDRSMTVSTLPPTGTITANTRTRFQTVSV